ncbi:MAG: I78 family peptidase inhibitor [Tabrizicola sp.]|uniref:I78 family peptidase inhibitor n=1 Tax=Tabrizicola sp. TaxID=2005166 RepID=UPI0027359104|nr:I78 family peptidase inhibitor [Tabrizicola sp.]MDP3264755.1 I78 family peptidase inhibitor [Tabrizicola sp.]MDP3647490.1 I78 family peptidase inhibitor [Paracoccaceae bacterium]MDZ4067031.1 I78 family peptidase inhibitor [Tabrizicola sp.]
MRFGIGVLMVALAACQPVKEAAGGSCGADGLQALIGQDKSVLAAMSFPAGTRFIEPGTPVTMDYSESRLNIHIGRTGRIERVSCG